MTNEQALDKQQALDAFSGLLANPAWRTEIEPFLRKAYEEHLEGCAARGKTAEQRSQHVEAFHLAKDLLGIVPARIEAIKKELAAFQKEQRGRSAL